MNHSRGGGSIAYVSNNHLPRTTLPDLIRTVHQALLALGTTTVARAPEGDRPTPAEVRKSITADALISFIDGRPYKTLKRHLSSHGLGPVQLPRAVRPASRLPNGGRIL